MGGAPERVAALACANFRRGDRRQRRNDADAEHHGGLKEIEAEGPGGERARRQAAEHDEVGRGHCVDRDIGEDDGPAEFAASRPVRASASRVRLQLSAVARRRSL